MSQTLPANGAVIVIASAANQGAAVSDYFTPQSTGLYTFNFTKVGLFTSLGFNLLSYIGVSPTTLLRFDGVLHYSFAVTLTAGTQYRLLCTAFVNGTSVSVSAVGSGSSVPAGSSAVGIVGQAIPQYAMLLGGKDPSGNLQPVSVDSSGRLQMAAVDGGSF